MRFLKLRLASPLQSWGDHARWDNRDTASAPSKSALIGLLGCCFGYERGDERLRELSDALRVAVRIDKTGEIMTDFHTVQGTDGVLLNAGGVKRSNGSTIITPRQYLQDALFTAFFWGDESLLDKCAYALSHPHWPPYLGRRSCVPSVPLIGTLLDADSVDQAVAALTEDEWNEGKAVRVAYIEMLPGEKEHPDESVIERRDNVVRANLNEYSLRRIRVCRIVKEGGLR